LLLEYSLAPEDIHPTQLGETVAVYNYLIDKLKIAPTNIILGGDSAGSSLTMQLLRHMKQPHPNIPTVPSSPRPKRCIMVSPWTKVDQDTPSYVTYGEYDTLPPSIVRNWGSEWKGRHSDEFTDPLTIPSEFWEKSFPTTLVISGQREIFHDDILLLCEKLKKVFPNEILLTLERNGSY
jgi:acetyl esterase/lipase